jgi:hypothetical protein
MRGDPPRGSARQLLSWTYSSSESLAQRLKSRATSTKSACGDYAYGIVRAGGLRLRSPQIYLPGALCIAYDIYFVDIHSLPGEAIGA